MAAAVEVELANRKRAGSKFSGKLRTGVVSSNAGVGSKSSIPTRFETILNTGDREKNAFWRRTYRFEDNGDELPGPGTYNKDRTIIKQSAVSLSKKGTSAFAKPVGLTPSTHLGGGPGPGAYSPPVAAQKLPSGQPSAVFASPSAKPVLRLARQAPPPLGPGYYFADAVPSTLTAPCAALTSRSDPNAKRSSQSQPTAAVGPGSYDTSSCALHVKDPLRLSHFCLSGTQRFAPPKEHNSAVQRLLATSLPPLLAASADVDRLGVPQTVSEVQSALRHQTGRTQSGGAQTHEFSKASSMFSDTNLDRFGRPIVRYTAPPSDALGPGSYDLQEKPRRMLISSAWALSGTKREEPKDRYQPPGPAYYSPATTGRVSHRVVDSASFVV